VRDAFRRSPSSSHRLEIARRIDDDEFLVDIICEQWLVALIGKVKKRKTTKGYVILELRDTTIVSSNKREMGAMLRGLISSDEMKQRT